MVEDGSQHVFSAEKAVAKIGCAADQLIDSCAPKAIGHAAEQSADDGTIDLQLGKVRLALSPARGGSILSFTWHNIDIFRPDVSGRNLTDLASFPLVPFCNRIADRRIQKGSAVHILPAAPEEIETEHALHGIGWTSDWSLAESSGHTASLSLEHDGTEWPWAFVARQVIVLTQSGYVHRLSLTNKGETPMPAGLGLHPYFPRSEAQLKLGASGFWENGPNRLPADHVALANQPDWFGGKTIDHCFTGSANPILVEWPTHRLRIHTSSNLPYTHVFVPNGAHFFCVEPVSHIPDAVNNPPSDAATGLKVLEPTESMEIECRFEVEAID